MDLALVKDIAIAASVILSVGATAYAWLTAKSKVNEEHLRAVDSRLADHAVRIQGVEGELKHLPAKDDVHGLKLALSELTGTVGRLEESHSGVSRSVRRIEEYLMKGSK